MALKERKGYLRTSNKINKNKTGQRCFWQTSIYSHKNSGKYLVSFNPTISFFPGYKQAYCSEEEIISFAICLKSLISCNQKELCE